MKRFVGASNVGSLTGSRRGLVMRLGFLAAAVATLIVPLASTQTVSILAGGRLGDGGPATEASLAFPRYVARDLDGSLLISDSAHNAIRRVDAATGDITTVVGGPISGFSGDGGPASLAKLNFPAQIVVDPLRGDWYIADQGNNRIRKVDRVTKTITTIAGNGSAVTSGDGGPATAAGLTPFGLALDGAGALYFTDVGQLNDGAGGSRVRKLDLRNGIVTTVAGNGVIGFSGDGGPALLASLNVPRGVLVTRDAKGAATVYIADTGNRRVRVVDSKGKITTIAGTGENGPVITTPTKATRVGIRAPRGLAFDSAGHLYIAGGSRVWRLDLKWGTIVTIAGGAPGFDGDGQPPLGSLFNDPTTGILVDGNGDLLVCDDGNGRIRRLDAQSGMTLTIAGGFIGDGGPAMTAHLNQPNAIAFGPDGAVYIADTAHHRVRRIDAKGTISTFAGTGVSGYNGDGVATAAMLYFPSGIAVNSRGEVFIADQFNQLVRMVDAQGVLTTIAFLPGGPGVLVIDSLDNLYTTDTDNCVVWKIDPSGATTLFAGTTCGRSPITGAPATGAAFQSDLGLARDGNGNTYIADADNSRVAVIDGAGGISPFAGTGSYGSAGDGGPAVAALLKFPIGAAVSSTLVAFIADEDAGVIRRVNAAGTIDTFAGTGNLGFAGNGVKARKASFEFLAGVTLGPSGDLFTLDMVRVMQIHPAK